MPLPSWRLPLLKSNRLVAMNEARNGSTVAGFFLCAAYAVPFNQNHTITWSLDKVPIKTVTIHFLAAAIVY